uniref:Uncharacterized protein n=1 Tax=Oryza sativa subsp. japonica TaxID=39947 RepID=Q6Z555_ORYSJ|nr:hypothetical protein [Oryza sativa Japonica Group]
MSEDKVCSMAHAPDTRTCPSQEWTFLAWGRSWTWPRMDVPGLGLIDAAKSGHSWPGDVPGLGLIDGVDIRLGLIDVAKSGRSWPGDVPGLGLIDGVDVPGLGLIDAVDVPGLGLIDASDLGDSGRYFDGSNSRQKHEHSR